MTLDNKVVQHLNRGVLASGRGAILFGYVHAFSENNGVEHDPIFLPWLITSAALQGLSCAADSLDVHDLSTLCDVISPDGYRKIDTVVVGESVVEATYGACKALACYGFGYVLAAALNL